MDEQRAWLKARRKRRLRILAVMLSACVLFTTYPDMLETLSAFASEESAQSETRHITDFTSLPDEVREQTVPVGTPLSELTLPDALEAVVTERQPKDGAEKPEDDGKEDSEENDSKEPDGDTDGTEDEDGRTIQVFSKERMLAIRYDSLTTPDTVIRSKEVLPGHLIY